jgi:hypothetical protein
VNVSQSCQFLSKVSIINLILVLHQIQEHVILIWHSNHTLNNSLFSPFSQLFLLCNMYIVMYTSDSGRGFGVNIGFIDHFNTQLIITFNYSTIPDFHTSLFTRAHAKTFPACSVFTRSCLVMAPTMAIPLLLCSSSF